MVCMYEIFNGLIRVYFFLKYGRWLVVLPDHKRKDRSSVAGKVEQLLGVSKMFQTLGSRGANRKTGITAG